MKGRSSLFGTKELKSGKWFGKSIILKNHNHPHRLPDVYISNNVITQIDDNGNIVKIRHYFNKGRVWKDVDYTDHDKP